MGRHWQEHTCSIFCFAALGSWKVGPGARPQQQLLPSGAIPTWLLFPRKEGEWRRAKIQKGISPALEFSLREEVHKCRAYRHDSQDLASSLYMGNNCLILKRQSNIGIKTRYLSGFMEVLSLQTDLLQSLAESRFTSTLAGIQKMVASSNYYIFYLGISNIYSFSHFIKLFKMCR